MRGGGTNETLFGFIALFTPRFRRGIVALALVPGAQGELFRLGQDKIRKAPAKKPASDAAKDKEMGSALRSVYQKTVEEAVPDDLLDLLGKLA